MHKAKMKVTELFEICNSILIALKTAKVKSNNIVWLCMLINVARSAKQFEHVDKENFLLFCGSAWDTMKEMLKYTEQEH